MDSGQDAVLRQLSECFARQISQFAEDFLRVGADVIILDVEGGEDIAREVDQPHRHVRDVDLQTEGEELARAGGEGDCGAAPPVGHDRIRFLQDAGIHQIIHQARGCGPRHSRSFCDVDTCHGLARGEHVGGGEGKVA